jgi:hypothetical protein
MSPKELRAQRKAEKEADKLKFPGARLFSNLDNPKASVIVQMEPGDCRHLRISQRGEWHKDGESEYWKVIWISLDIEELGQFIHALVCRYNAMVEEANQLTEKSKIYES